MNISIENLLKQKSNADNKSLDPNKLNYILDIFSTQSYRDNKFTYNKYNNKNRKQEPPAYKNNNILKNKTLQNKKESVANRINLILNKLSENNIEPLINEYIDNIGNLDELNWQICQRTFYSKMLSENKFMKIYIIFFKIISVIYNYDINYFINLLETKFKLDYVFDFETEDTFLQNLSNENLSNENLSTVKRNNNLHLIYNLVSMNILDNNLFDYCDNIIINQILYTEDIYNWFILRDIKLSNDKINIIKKHINESILPRNKILLLNLIDLNSKRTDAVYINKTNNKIIDTPTIVSQDTSNDTPTIVSQDTSNDIPTIISQDTSNDTPTIISQDTSNDIPTIISQDTSNDIPTIVSHDIEKKKDDVSNIEYNIDTLLDSYLENPKTNIIDILSKLDFTNIDNITKIILKYMNVLETESNILLKLYKELITLNILDKKIIINTKNTIFKTRNIKLINRIKKFNTLLE
jgi:hypothetical protein